MPETLRIITGARLHFGPFSHAPERRGSFGGIGLMIDALGWQIDFRTAESDRVIAPERSRERIVHYLTIVRHAVSADGPHQKCEIEVRNQIPGHCGLGSGTQLALAVARGVLALAGQSEFRAESIASELGRGARSAIGIRGFQTGGFLVDAGKGGESPTDLGQIVVRKDFPETWRWLLIVPRAGQGLSGPDERRAFQELPPMPLATTERLCRLTLLEMLPALDCQDLNRFANALYEYGRMAGEYFAPAQGGGWMQPASLPMAAWLLRQGFRGVVQSSWGPAVAVLCESAAQAKSLGELLKDGPLPIASDLTIAAGMNCGAAMQRLMDAQPD